MAQFFLRELADQMTVPVGGRAGLDDGGMVA